LNYGRDLNEGLEKEYENAVIGDAQPTGRFSETRFRRQTENFNQILSYNTSFDNKHNIELTLGHESFDRNYTQNDGLAVDQTAIWGNFYSIGASWRLGQEAFLQDVPFIDRMKLRASYGQVGNDNLLDFYLSQPRYSLSSNAGNPAILWSDIGNSLLQWETVESFDVALEFTLFNNFLDGSIEYYKRNSSDLLYDLPIALSNGLNAFPSNIGDMYNSGIELGLTGNIITTPDFRWGLTLTATKQKNEITSLPDPFVSGTKRWDVGKSRYDFYIRETAGVDPETGDQLFYVYELDDDGNSVPVMAEDGTQETTNDWEATERTYTGASSIPDLIGSVANSLYFKGISFDFLVTYGIGGDILDFGYANMMHSGTYGRSLHPDILNAWTQPGDMTDVPRMENGNPNLVRTESTRFLTDASYWALRNVNLGYTLGNNIVGKLGMENIRVSITGENLFLKSKREGLNPQYNLAGTPSGNDFNPARIISLGLSADF